MLTRVNRLTGTGNFDRVKEEGSLFQSESFAIAILLREDEEPSRFGFIVSNKISKRANIRNKIKRILREAVKANLPELKSGFDVIFLVKKVALARQAKDIMNEVSIVFKKADLFK
ncbi:ribonuclease P protein component [Candidatus Woesebacteria bacterium]|nr:MAG: ribonuclease P protein component [Candidatus Woesebacteria bacterium]